MPVTPDTMSYRYSSQRRHVWFDGESPRKRWYKTIITITSQQHGMTNRAWVWFYTTTLPINPGWRCFCDYATTKANITSQVSDSIKILYNITASKNDRTLLTCWWYVSDDTCTRYTDSCSELVTCDQCGMNQCPEWKATNTHAIAHTRHLNKSQPQTPTTHYAV